MKIPHFYRLQSGVAFLLMALLAACGGNADSTSSKAHVRLLNLSTGYESLDVYANNGDSETDTTLFTSVARDTLSAYVDLKSDTYTLKFRKSGTSGNLSAPSTNLASGSYITVIAYGGTNSFALDLLDEEVDNPGSGYTNVQVVNTSFDKSFDVYFTGSSDSLDDVSASISSVGSRTQSGVTKVSSGTFRARITRSGVKSDIRLNIPELTLPSAGVISIIIKETDGGVLVNAIVLPKQGQPTTYGNASSSYFRVLNMSSGYDPLDVYTADTDGSNETQRFSSVTRGTATAYASPLAATYSLRFRRTGAAGTLLSAAATLAEEKHATFVTYGATNHFSLLRIDEDVSAPDAGYVKLQVLNTTGADNLDIYLTDSADSLDNVSAAVSGAGPGTLSSVTTVRSGTYRLRVTKSGEKQDVRLDVPTITLRSQEILSLVLGEADGGVLLNAVLLPQQSDPVRIDNTNVRVRGAFGLPSGSLASLQIGSQQIVANRSARSFIGDTYSILPSGTVSVAVFVDNAQVGSQSVTLQPGGDYTMLVWSSGGTLRISALPDSNTASANQRPRIRLLNGASGLAAPLTLLANYSPVGEYIQTGTASGVAELLNGQEVRLDVISADSLATLLTRESVTLENDGVYTLFVAGGGSSSVTGILRRDR